jgi:hypothetical protein
MEREFIMKKISKTPPDDRTILRNLATIRNGRKLLSVLGKLTDRGPLSREDKAVLQAEKLESLEPYFIEVERSLKRFKDDRTMVLQDVGFTFTAEGRRALKLLPAFGPSP